MFSLKDAFFVKKLRCGLQVVVVSLLGTAAFCFCAPVHAEDAAAPTRSQITLTFAPVVKKVAPAVVNIYTRKLVKRAASPFANDPVFQRFFGGNPQGIPREQMENSLGSGVLIRADGIVVTNNHVIDGAEEIKVVLHDRREYAAKLVGIDRDSDLAVLRLDGTPNNLPTVALGSTDALEVGDVVLALGNPFGVGQTVTMGIVSALARSANVAGGNTLNTFIQTDAAINPGNSGGALVTDRGSLIGINAMIYSNSGGSLGIGFAIPVEMVKIVVADLLGGGKVVHPWLGANTQMVTGNTAASLGLDRPLGVLVSTVIAGGAADKAGLKAGDVVTTIDGHEVSDPGSLRYRVATGEVGGVAKLSVWRDGKTLALKLPLQAPPDLPPRAETIVIGENPLQGARIANENPALAAEVGFNYRPNSVIILAVNPQGFAARFVQVGDVVLNVNGQAIDSVKGLEDTLMKGRVNGAWVLTVERGGRSITLQVR